MRYNHTCRNKDLSADPGVALPRALHKQLLKRSEYMKQNNEKMRRVDYLFRNDGGEARISSYTVFPGVTLSYNSVHTDSFRLGLHAKPRGVIVEINHCLEGRIEQQSERGLFYLMPGDMSVSLRSDPAAEYSFPLRHYHGISILIDTGLAPSCFSCFMEDVNVRPAKIAENLCRGGDSFVLRSQKYTEHIFSELYTAPENCKTGFFKVKILELLLVLGNTDPADNGLPLMSVTRQQARLAKEASQYMLENMSDKISVDDLARRFHVSQTHLQNAFKGVYGVPIYSFQKIQKMNAAALQLIHTERTVTDIASEFGYDNTSKFSAAFAKIMGETPAEYRKQHGGR